MSDAKQPKAAAKPKNTAWERVQKDLRAQSQTQTRPSTLAERQKLMEKRNG